MFFPLLNLGGNFEKESSDWPSCDLKSAVVTPHKSNYYSQNVVIHSFCPILANLGTFVHFVVNSNLEMISVDSEIFVRAMTLSILKCGSALSPKSIPLVKFACYFSNFRKAKNIVPVDQFAKLVRTV